MTEIRINRTAASATFELRQLVLRPNQAIGEMTLPGDDDPDTAHFCAVDQTGRVVGTGSVRREPPPWAPSSAAWRLRGMATRAEARSLGIGSQVLAAIVDHVAGLGGGLLWCNARIPALEFYKRAGFVTRGEPWEDPAIGPHIVMERQVIGDQRP